MSARDEVIVLIDEFLNKWKESNFNFFIERRSRVIELNNHSNYFSSEVYNSYNFMPSRYINLRVKKDDSVNYYNETNIERFLERCDFELSVSEFKSMLDSYAKGMKLRNSLMDTLTSRLVSENKYNAINYLNKYLDREVKARKVTFIDSIENAGGDMVKVMTLKIGDDSMLNGIISCVNADVKIETVGAGGYNIQRFHYRILCHALKDRVNKNIKDDLKTFVAPKKKSKSEIQELEISDYILSQAKRLESKKNKEGKSRGKDIWDKINDLGYLKLIESSGYIKYLDTESYPIYIKDLDENRQFIWCMAFAYTLNKNTDLPAKKRISLFWNVEGTDSMERVLSMMNRLKFTEFENIIPLMAKRGKFVRYGEKSVEELKEEEKNNKINSLSVVDESSDEYLKNNSSSEHEYHTKTNFRDRVTELEGYADFRGVKVWERMKEFGYDKKLKDMGYKLYVQTKLYPYFYKDYDDYRIVLGMTVGYIITDFKTEHARFNNIYYLVKGGDSKVSDFEKLFKNYNHEEFKMFSEVFNLRKKLETYTSSSDNIAESIESIKTVSNYNININLLEDVITNIVTDINDENNSIRLKKVIKRFNENNLNNYFLDNGYEEVYLTLKNKKLPIPVFIKKYNDYHLIITYQQIYLLESNGRLITIGNTTSYDSTLKEVKAFGEKHKINDVVIFSQFNNLRLKLEPYITNK